jgi:hypothetical protein
MFKHKLKASLIHLGLSLALVALLIGSIVFLWFPLLFIEISDFKKVASIIITVDLILGPLLTFVVFQPQKASLRFDLSVIVAIQVVALLYGSYALYQVHPVYITFNVDRFTLINARDAEPEKAKYDEYRVSKLTSANFAYASVPTDPQKMIELTVTAAAGGGDLDQREEYYEPYKRNIDKILLKSLDPDTIFSKKNVQDETTLFLQKYEKNLGNYAFFPLNNMEKDAIIVLDKKTAEAIAMINIDPWSLK